MGEPKVVFVGDSPAWSIADVNHPSQFWTMLVYLQGSGSTATAYSSSAIDSSSFAVTASISGDPGRRYWSYVFTSGSIRQTLPGGSVMVEPNPSGSAYDPRTHAQRVLDAIEAVLEGRASIDQQTITIAGRTLSRTPLQDLLKLRGRYRDEVKNEEVAVRASLGLASGRKVLVRM